MSFPRSARLSAKNVARAKLRAVTGSVEAVEKGSQQVSPFHGSFSYAIPIETPRFHGLEPALALSYSSEGRNGPAGVGWTLSGFGLVERVNAGGGTPTFTTSDTYVVDGQKLVACASGSASPSCTSGGTHSAGTSSPVCGKDTKSGASPRVTVSQGSVMQAVLRGRAGSHRRR